MPFATLAQPLEAPTRAALRMEKFIIEGGYPLSGTVVPAGNKNAALPLLAASLLTEEEIVLRNVPRIRDVEAMIQLLIRLGVKTSWLDANVVRGSAKGTVSAVAYARLGDVTSEQFRALAAIQRDLGLEVRLTNRQNVAFRGLTEEQLPQLFERLDAIGMSNPGAELVRDVVACPGADTCNLAVTQSRGLASAIGDKLEEEGLAEGGGLRINISGCTNSCGQHHQSDIGFYGAERRAHGKSAPGYQMLLGGYVGQTQIHFGERATRSSVLCMPRKTSR